MTSSCEFSKECLSKKCDNYTICALLNTEKHINSIESRITELFESINSLLLFSSNSGKEIVLIKDHIERIKLTLLEISEKEEQILLATNKNSELLEELTGKIVNLEKKVSLSE